MINMWINGHRFIDRTKQTNDCILHCLSIVLAFQTGNGSPVFLVSQLADSVVISTGCSQVVDFVQVRCVCACVRASRVRVLPPPVTTSFLGSLWLIKDGSQKHSCISRSLGTRVLFSSPISLLLLSGSHMRPIQRRLQTWKYPHWHLARWTPWTNPVVGCQSNQETLLGSTSWRHKKFEKNMADAKWSNARIMPHSRLCKIIARETKRLDMARFGFPHNC